MENWSKISALLCVFGFLTYMCPSDPYLTEFLLGDWRNITQDEINREILPVGTYSYLGQLVIVFLVTDILRYKAIIIAKGCAGIIVWSLLLWTTSVTSLQISQFLYGSYMATEVAYYTYIYAKVDKKYYPKVSSHTRAAILCGKLVAGISSQLFIYFELMDYRDLNYITLGAQICATLWAFGLPSVDTSTYFHRKEKTDNVEASTFHINTSTVRIMAPTPVMSPTALLWSHFKKAYTNVKVVEWSLWYALGLGGYYQVIFYIQVLWKDIEPDPTTVWNGAVEAVLTLLGAILSLIAGYIHAGRLSPLGSLLVLATVSVLEGFALLLSCWTHNLYISYAGYVLYGCLFAFTITVASAEVAQYLEEDSFALVFGINTFMALVFQTILTVTIVAESGLALTIVQQYFVYAFYFIIVGVIYFLAVAVEYIWFKPSVDTDFIKSN